MVIPFAFGKLRSRAAWWSLLAGPLTTVAIAIALFGSGWLAHRLFWELPAGGGPQEPTALLMSGLLLALQLSVAYAWRTMAWTGEPMGKANLGSVVRLQLCRTPNQVAECLERWRVMLVCRWSAGDEDAVNGPAARRMRALLGEVLYRDLLGFIPVYTLVLLFGLWFGQHSLWPDAGGLLALWWLLPAVAAVTDYAEDFCHLRYRALHARGQKPTAALTLFSFSMTSIKIATFTVAAGITGLAVLLGTWRLDGQDADWRAKTALVITVLALLALAAGLLARAIHFFRHGKKEH
jgi:hypothetical protein